MFSISRLGLLAVATLLFTAVAATPAFAADARSATCPAMLEVAFVDATGAPAEVPAAHVAVARQDTADGDFLVRQALTLDEPTLGAELAVDAGMLRVEVQWLAEGAESRLLSRRLAVATSCGDTARLAVTVPSRLAGAGEVDSLLPTAAARLGTVLDGHGTLAALPLKAGFGGTSSPGDSQPGDVGNGLGDRAGTGGRPGGTTLIDPNVGIVDETEPGDTFECLLDPFSDGIAAGWSHAFLGDADQGEFLEVGGKLRVSGDGTSLYHDDDNAYFVYREADGDFRAEVELSGVPVDAGGGYRKFGLMVRAGLETRAARVMVQFIPNHPVYSTTALQFDYRDENGVASELASTPLNIPLPSRIAITRRGDVFTAYFSTDGGNTWLVPAGGAGGTVSIAMPQRTLVGVDVASYDANTTMTAEFDNFQICNPNTDPLPPPPPGGVCEPGSVLDVVYLLDTSGSMTAPYPGAATKLDAAVNAIDAMNTLLGSELPGSRAALVTFAGNSEPDFNLTSAVRVRSGLTGDLAGVTAIAQSIDPASIDPRSSTPVAIALDHTLDLLLAEHDPAKVPILIWLTDTVPNIDADGRGPSFYRFDEVQEISLYDATGGFLPWGSVAWMGNYNGAINTYDGEVLANSMYEILRLREEIADSVVFGVAIQGDGVSSDVFRTDLLEFAAAYTGGGVYAAEDSTGILDSLIDIVSVVNCGSALSGRVWDDADADGAEGPSELGLADVTVELVDSLGTVVDTTTTAPDGSYNFDGLLPGTYTVRVVTATLPNGSAPTYDVDGVATPHVATVTLVAAETRDDVDFGYVQVDDGPVDGCIGDGFSDGILGAGWLESPVGNDTLGGVVETGGGLELTSNGTDLYHGADNGYFAYRQVTGDFRVEVDVTGFPVDEGGDYRKAGLMVRGSNSSTAARAMIQVVPHFPPNDVVAVQFDVRTAPGATPIELGSTIQGITLPVRLALQKRGATIEAFLSTDGGTTWIKPAGGAGGEADVPALEVGALAGVMGASYDATQPFTARFDDFELCQPEDTDPTDPPPPGECDPTKPLDVLYLMDMSGSMTWEFPGNGTKFEAARMAWMTLNDSLSALGNGSRAALVTFSGKGNVPFNTTSAVRVRTGFTGDFVYMDSVVDSLDMSEIPPEASTPLPLAFETVRDVFANQHDPLHTPVVVWISDSLPNIDLTGEGPHEYPLEVLQEIPLRDQSGVWRSIGDVAWSGAYQPTTDTYQGEPLANSMEQVQLFKGEEPEVRIFGITIMGDGVGLGTYSFELNQYAAYFTNGEARTADTAGQLALQIVETLEGVLCGEPGPATIGDRVWDDVDGDGVQDGDETGLEGVVVDLVDDAGQIVASAVTDANGNYLFVDVPAGDYTVVIDVGSLAAGSEATYDLDGIATPHSAMITVIPYEVKLDVDFGYRIVDEPPPVEGCITDRFDDGVVDPAWAVDFLGDADQGDVDESGGALHVTGDGTAMFSDDNGLFVYRTASTTALRTEVDILGSVGGATIFRKTGLMVRSGLDPLAPRVTVQYQPEWPDARGSLQFRYRATQGADGGATWATSYVGITPPVRVAIEKQGDTYTVEFSQDGGTTWVRPAGGAQGEVTIDMGDDLLVGMTSTSYDASATLTGSYDEFLLCDLDLDDPPGETGSECVDEAEVSIFNSDGGHALWLPGISEMLVFDGDQGAWVTYDDGTATLDGRVVLASDPSTGFVVDVDLSGATDVAPAGSPKKELSGVAYAPRGPVDPSTWSYYPTWTGSLQGFGAWEGALIELTPRGPAWQVGAGANNKNTLDGASAWLSWQVIDQPTTGTTLRSTGIGDFNLAFACPDLEYCVADALDDGTTGSANHALALPGLAKDLLLAEPARFIEYDNGSALFTGTVYDKRDSDRVFDFVVHLDGVTTDAPPGSPKLELPGGVYFPSGAIDPSLWWYYSEWSGTLYGRGEVDGAIVTLTARGPAWQIGDGANNKNQVFGASAWLDYTVVRQPSTGVTLNANGVGDWNVDYVCPPDDGGGGDDQIVCGADALGESGGFNLFLLGDLTQSATDSEGRVAAGGDVDLTSYSVGLLLGTLGGDSLVAGGDLRFHNGQVHGGDLAHGGSLDMMSSTVLDGVAYQGTPVDFAAAAVALDALADGLAGEPTNGTTDVAPWGAITLEGTDSERNVFRLAALDLASATSLTIEVPAGATAIVNVDGSSVTIQNFGISLDGATNGTVLWNLHEADSLQMSGIGMLGSVLAPAAVVTFNNGQLNGTLVGAELTGGGQLNHHPFAGCLPLF
ncbi:MAG: choice-of-anchor A family protein [Acidobacteriota bacterium]